MMLAMSTIAYLNNYVNGIFREVKLDKRTVQWNSMEILCNPKGNYSLQWDLNML